VTIQKDGWHVRLGGELFSLPVVSVCAMKTLSSMPEIVTEELLLDRFSIPHYEREAVAPAGGETTIVVVIISSRGLDSFQCKGSRG